MFKLRPHHGICIQKFIGRGYSEDFVKNMTELIAYLNAENPLLEVACGCDEICKGCPDLTDGRCKSEEKAERIDRDCLAAVKLADGRAIRYKDYAELVRRKIIASGKGKEICADCQWRSLCY